MSDFENWFKTTSAYRMLESMNYYKMDLFHWVEVRGEYRHTSVQIACMTWVEQQAKIDELQKQIDVVSESIDSFFDNQVGTPTQREYCNFIAEIKQALRGEHEQPILCR